MEKGVEEGVEVEGMDRERRRKRMGGMRRGGLRWEDIAVSEWVLVCIFERVILCRVSQCLLGLQGMMIRKKSFQAAR